MKSEPEGFPEAWALWRPHMRKNDGRGEARAAFAKHIKSGASPADIIDGIRFYLRGLTEAERPYIPMFSTWVNRGAYEDGAIAEREYQQRIAERAAQASRAPTNVHSLRPADYKTPFLKAYEARELEQIAKAGA